MAAATAQDAPGKQLSKQQAPASRREKEPAKPAWKPKPLPKFHPGDFVVVLKPWTALELGAIFQPGELGLSLRTYLGAQLAADCSFVLSREQNLILASTQNAYVADRILGDFVINSVKDVPLRGHLKQGDEEVSYGVVSIANRETSETLEGSIQWRQGTILDIRKFGTSNRAQLTFTEKVKPRTVLYNSEIITVRPCLRTIPARGLCSTVGHRADTCPSPNPNQDRCGLEGMRAPHECNAKCAVCGGGHATNSRVCGEIPHAHQTGRPKAGESRLSGVQFRRRGSRRNVSRHTSLAVAVTHHGAVTPTRRGRHGVLLCRFGER